jgi:ribonuclease Z
MTRIIIILGLVIALCAGAFGAATLSPRFDRWIYARTADYLLHRQPPAFGNAGELSVLLCGTDAPLPDPRRAGACTAVSAGGDIYIVDSGLTSVRNLLMWRVPLAHVKAVLLTHFHSDHIGELGELQLQTWVAGRKTPLRVYGPPGVEDVVSGFNLAYSHDADYRTAHHGANFLPRNIADLSATAIPMTGATAPALKANGLVITAIRVDHGPVKPAYGYRFDYGGRSVTISGDTSAYEPLAAAARDSDVLVHEAQSNDLVAILGAALDKAGNHRAAKIMHDIPSYHTTPVQAAQIANDAHAKLLVFTHVNPPLPNWIAERAFLAGVSEVRPDGWVLGYDGLLLRLPVHSTAIEQTRVD